MPKLSVKENVEKMSADLEMMSKEVFRLEGSLRVFRSLLEAGVEEVDIPEKDEEGEETKPITIPEENALEEDE
mgnify:CR=1 FL=1|jgi:hypothetical protein